MNNLEIYINGLKEILDRILREQQENIRHAGHIVAESLSRGGVIHTFGTGHSHIISEEIFFRAGGIAAVNPILDERLIFLKGALESTRAEREEGFAQKLIAREDVRDTDTAIIISNSGRNAVPVEMALGMKKRGTKVIAITSLGPSQATTARWSGGKKLYEVADLTIDNCVPPGDALVKLDGLASKTAASSTVAGAAIVHSIVISALEELLTTGKPTPVLQSANVAGSTADALKAALEPYRGRIRYIDPDTELD
ncbi:MAG TPA: SIS domain-containing protein [Pyrinomonadaceae bacterium]|nr:SIS domain-containing protein [Pyrinomonadaceae bacterium]